MHRYIGHIPEETWPEARAILDAFRVDYRTTPDRHAGHVKGYNVWVEAEDLHTEPWWEELVQAGWDGRQLCSPEYDTLRLRLELAHSAVEAAAVEARRRVRLGEERV